MLPFFFFLLPYCRSKTARPGSPFLPLNHLPCPRSCQDLPPQSLQAAALLILHPTCTQHLAPKGREKQPVRGMCALERQEPNYKKIHSTIWLCVCLYWETYTWYIQKKTHRFILLTDAVSVGVVMISILTQHPSSASDEGHFCAKINAKWGDCLSRYCMSMGLWHPEARIDARHMVSVSWRNCMPQAPLRLLALKPTEIWWMPDLHVES